MKSMQMPFFHLRRRKKSGGDQIHTTEQKIHRKDFKSGVARANVSGSFVNTDTIGVASIMEAAVMLSKR